MSIRLSLMLVVTVVFLASNQRFSAQPGQEVAEKIPALLLGKPLKPQPGDDELRKLVIARYNSAIAEGQARYKDFQAGRKQIGSLSDVLGRLAESGMEATIKPADQIDFLGKYLEMARAIEKAQQAQFDAGHVNAADFERAKYLRLNAEIQLLRMTQSAKGKGAP